MNLYLIGYRGSGKSSVGRLLATRLNLAWVDTDQLIEQHCGKRIAEIFAESGEPYFREIERATVCSLVDADVIVSLGGGAVVDTQSRQHVKETGRCVWLQARPSTLHARISSDATDRPALTTMESLQEIVRVLNERTPVYAACAEYSVDTEQLTIEQAADQIAHWWLSSR